MALNAGDVVWNIGANLEAFKKGMNQAQKGGKKLGAALVKNSRAIGLGFAAAGGAVTAFVGSSVKGFVTLGDAVQKMSIRTGASTEAISELKFAAEQSGASMETVGKAFKAQADFLEDAKDGLSTSTDAMDKLGLTLEDLAGKTPEQVFMTLSSAIGGIQDPLQRAALANDVFKRSGQELLPMFAQGAEGIAALRAEAQALGVSLSQEQADAAAKFADSMNSLKTSMSGVGIQIGSILVPLLTSFVNSVTPIITKLSAWAAENPKIAKTILIVVAAVGAFMLALAPLLIVLPGIIAAFGVAVSAAAFFGTTIGGLIAIIAAVVATVFALGVVIVKNWTWIKDSVVNIFRYLRDTAISVWDSISSGIGRFASYIAGHIQGIIAWIQDAIEWFKKLAFWRNSEGGGGNNRQSKASGGLVKGYASGGKTKSNIVKVGERGAELAALPTGTRVLSHPDMMRAAQQGAGGSSGGGDMVINNTFNINGAGETDPDKLMDKLKLPFSTWMRSELKTAMR